jgi:methionyl-tRNA synthetase
MLGVPAQLWTGLAAGALSPGTTLGPVESLFPRIEHTLEELRAMATDDTPAAPAPDPAPAAPPVTAAEDPRISIDDFMKVELRTATVLDAEAVPKSRKLLKLRVEVGAEQRTILAGIAEAYAPEQLVGRTVVIVANLKPAKLMGIESNGMVLAASADGGTPVLAAFAEPVESGWRVR